MLGEGFAHNPRTLLHIAPYLRSRSVSPVEIFRRADISPSTLLDANGWVPRELCFRLSDEMHKVTGERFLGADVGRSFRLSDLGTWGVAVSGAATLRQACATAVEWHRSCSSRHRSETPDGRQACDPELRISRPFQPGTEATYSWCARRVAQRGIAGRRARKRSARASRKATNGQESGWKRHLVRRSSSGARGMPIVIDREILDLPIALRRFGDEWCGSRRDRRQPGRVREGDAAIWRREC